MHQETCSYHPSSQTILPNHRLTLARDLFYLRVFLADCREGSKPFSGHFPNQKHRNSSTMALTRTALLALVALVATSSTTATSPIDPVMVACSSVILGIAIRRRQRLLRPALRSRAPPPRAGVRTAVSFMQVRWTRSAMALPSP